MLTSRRGVERPPFSRRIGIVAVVLLGITGLALFVYADRASNHPLRLSAAVMVTIALLVGAVMTGRRNARVKTAPGKRS